jgi:hypothetical protein
MLLRQTVYLSLPIHLRSINEWLPLLRSPTILADPLALLYYSGSIISRLFSLFTSRHFFQVPSLSPLLIFFFPINDVSSHLAPFTPSSPISAYVPGILKLPTQIPYILQRNSNPRSSIGDQISWILTTSPYASKPSLFLASEALTGFGELKISSSSSSCIIITISLSSYLFSKRGEGGLTVLFFVSGIQK